MFNGLGEIESGVQVEWSAVPSLTGDMRTKEWTKSNFWGNDLVIVVKDDKGLFSITLNNEVLFRVPSGWVRKYFSIKVDKGE